MSAGERDGLSRDTLRAERALRETRLEAIPGWMRGDSQVLQPRTCEGLGLTDSQ